MKEKIRGALHTNAGNRVAAINTLAVPRVTYSFKISPNGKLLNQETRHEDRLRTLSTV